MTDVTNDWSGGNKSRSAGANSEDGQGDRVTPNDVASRPVADLGASEPKSFNSGKTATGHEPAGAEEPLLQVTLETIRVKAEELGEQARSWTKVRQDQAIDMIDERPLTTVAAAFGVGLVIGALLSR